MSLSVEDERDKWVEWKRNAKGRGYRWILQRNLVCVLSLKPLTTTEVQAVMSLKHGMSNATSFKLMSELRHARALDQFLEADMGYFWRATDKGVGVYLGSRKAIPAGVAGELLSLASANELEGSEVAESGSL